MPRRRRLRLNVPFLCAIGLFVLVVAGYIGLGVLAAAMAPKRLGMPAGLTLPLLARTLDAVTAVWFFAVGASIGSFLNVVAYRLPLGKTLLGNSACPYCCTPIAAADNIPVFAWLRLRGRCRTCRLPISIEYPLIELMVGLVFLTVYFTEFVVGGGNLPGTALRPATSGLVWMSVTPLLATRVAIYLFALSGLIAAALIALRRVETPLAIFGWVLLVLTAGELIMPTSVVVPAWLGESSGGPAGETTWFDALATFGLGWLAGLIAAALTQPLLQRATSHVAWYAALSCVGAIVGWQWAATATACILLVALLVWWSGSRLLRGPLKGWSWAQQRSALVNPVVWAWLGLLIFRANWKSLDEAFGGFQSTQSWLAVGLSAALALLAAWLIGLAARGSTTDVSGIAPFAAEGVEMAEQERVV